MIRTPTSFSFWLACAAVVLLATACGGATAPAAAPTTAPVTAKAEAELPAATTDSVSAKAVFVPLREAALSYGVSGRVDQVLVTPGEVVKAGQELARLKLSDLEQPVLQAEADLRSAEALLAKVKAGASVEENAEAEAAVSMAQAGVRAREASVTIVTANLEAARADLKTAENGVTVARSNVDAANARLVSARAALNKIVAGPSATEVKIAEAELERARNEQEAIERQRDATFNVLEGKVGAAQAAVAIAQLRLEQLKAGARPEDLAAAQARASQATAGVDTARARLAQAQAIVAEAQAVIETREVQLRQSLTQLEGARAQVEQVQARLDLIKSGSRAEDVAMAEAAVARAQAGVASARNRLDDGTLRAPFDGTVGEILLREGEQAAPGIAALRLGDLTRFKVQTEDLSEVDVDQVKVGQAAQVTVDALEGEVIDGKVTRIASVASDRRGDKVYVVTVEPVTAPEANLRWGMTAFVEIDVR
jgi:HlyD family secretion protein